jgi:hypothetical protein
MLEHGMKGGFIGAGAELIFVEKMWGGGEVFEEALEEASHRKGNVWTVAPMNREESGN